MATSLKGPQTGTFQQFLVSSDIISDSALDRAERLVAEGTERLGTILLKLGLISEASLARAYAAYLDIPHLEGSEFPDTALLTGELSARFLKKSGAIPVAENPKEVTVALSDPTDTETIDAIRYALGRPIKCKVALVSDLGKAYERLYEESHGASRIVANYEPSSVTKGKSDAERLRDLTSEAPIIQAVSYWIERACEIGASDIHLEPTETTFHVRFRIDGELQDIEDLPPHTATAVSSRIKVMSRLNIAERRLPQDGKLRLPVRGRDIDFRVSIIPTVHGESIVLRVLDRGQIELDFRKLGFDEDALSRFQHVLHRPHGIMLVTGPTGSGKTTTLYTALSELRSSARKILTIEDPVEYQLEGVNQTQVQPQIGLTFATGLRSFLRHDPDIILVGEIRDTETARIAVQAALTGHLVLSTLHTNDAASAITRLMDMGVDSYLIASTVNGIAAQRLVRRLCPACRKIGGALSNVTNLANEAPQLFYRPIGCMECRGTGYKGRCVITETLVMTDKIRSSVLKCASLDEIRELAEKEGMETMYKNGLRKCAAGETTLEEVLRVTTNL